MKTKQLVKVGAAFAVTATTAAAVTPALAAASTPKVSVRVEGLHKTLLKSTTVRSRTGTFKRSGHAIRYQSALGALQLAVSGHWAGTWSSSYKEWELTGVDGESHPFSSKDFWAVYVNHVQAQTGIDQVALKAGQQIVLAVLPDSNYDEDLIGATAPRTATRGRRFTVRAFYYDSKGHRHALAGATVNLNGHRTTTGASGAARITINRTGTKTLTFSKSGYVRDEVTVRVKA